MNHSDGQWGGGISQRSNYLGHIDNGQHRVSFKGLTNLHRYHMEIEVSWTNILLVWLCPTVVQALFCTGQCFNSTPLRVKFHMGLFHGAVSLLLIELPRTVKGQMG